MRSFTVTAASKEVKLDAKGNASVTFTVTNTNKNPVRGTPKLKPLGSTGGDWLKLPSGGTRNFSPNESQQFVVEIAVPPASKASEYSFGLNISNEALPEDDFTEGPAVTFTVPEPREPNGKPKPFPWWILILIGVVLLGGGVTIAILLKPSKQTVPNVVGKSISEASNLLAHAELSLEVAEHLATGTNQIGVVIHQNPLAGKNVVKGTIVALTIEKERDKIIVPDLIGLPPEQLQKVYGHLRIKMALENKAYTGTQQPGLIAAQRPAAGTPVDPGAQVSYTVEDKKPEDPAPAYVGTWDNVNVGTIYIKSFTITWRDKRAYVRVWSRDSVTDWGEKEAKLSGFSQLETTWDRGSALVILHMNVEDQRIRLKSESSPKGAGPPRLVTEVFTPRRFTIERFKTPMFRNP